MDGWMMMHDYDGDGDLWLWWFTVLCDDYDDEHNVEDVHDENYDDYVFLKKCFIHSC